MRINLAAYDLIASEKSGTMTGSTGVFLRERKEKLMTGLFQCAPHNRGCKPLPQITGTDHKLLWLVLLRGLVSFKLTKHPSRQLPVFSQNYFPYLENSLFMFFANANSTDEISFPNLLPAGPENDGSVPPQRLQSHPATELDRLEEGQKPRRPQ